MKRRSERLVRFTATERWFHWAQGLPYLALMATGGLLLAQRLVGVEAISAYTLSRAHRIAGVALPVAMLLAFLAGDKRKLLRNLGLALRFGLEDLRWLFLYPLNALFPGLRVPAAGKFNSGQKVNLLAQAFLIPTFLITGAVMWLSRGSLLSWYVHIGAFALSVPLIFGHLYLALFNSSTRKGLPGVFSGRVDARWAREHYPLEYGVGGDELE